MWRTGTRRESLPPHLTFPRHRAKGLFVMPEAVMNVTRSRLSRPSRRRSLLLILLALLAVVPALGLVVTTGGKAAARHPP